MLKKIKYILLFVLIGHCLQAQTMTFGQMTGGTAQPVSIVAPDETMLQQQIASAIADSMLTMRMEINESSLSGSHYHEQAILESTWTVNHNKGRAVLIEIYVTSGGDTKRVYPNVSNTDLNTTIIEFDVPSIGYVRIY